EGPRWTTDYIEIAREFNTVLLGGIPRMDASNEDAARRFVNLVDELYDRQVNLVCTADAQPTGLYEGQRLQGAFERTASRLIEMQSAEYLGPPHRACASAPRGRVLAPGAQSQPRQVQRDHRFLRSPARQFPPQRVRPQPGEGQHGEH